MIPAPTKYKRNMWCGPYALAVALGVDYDEAYELLRRVSRKRQIKGTAYVWMLWALKRHRIRTEFKNLTRSAGVRLETRWKDGKCITLRGCTDYLKPNRLYIVTVTGHYVVVDTSDGTCIDNQTMGWFPLDHHPNALKRVVNVAEVKRVER